MSSHAQIGPQGAEIKLLTVPSLDGMVSVGKTHFISAHNILLQIFHNFAELSGLLRDYAN